MIKFAVFSGFLGSGKTTTMMALTTWHSAHRGAAAMISNDLGGPGLADHKLAQLSGCNASELTEVLYALQLSWATILLCFFHILAPLELTVGSGCSPDGC